jgi:hypothetical protein
VFALVAAHARNRNAALALVRENGGRIRFNPRAKLPWAEKWLSKLFGAETYQPVQGVNMLTIGFRTEESRNKLPDDFLARLSALSELTDLGLDNTIIAKSDWHNLSRFSHLFQLMLSSSNITDEGVESLSQLPELAELDMIDVEGITDAALISLSRLPKLGNLQIANSRISDQGLRNFKPISHPQSLNLLGNKITSSGVESIKQIPTLLFLSLAHTDVDDQALDYLAELPSLQKLAVGRTHVTPGGVQRFRQLHPKCTVTGP